MKANNLYLPQKLDFSFNRLHPIIYLKWKEPNIYYFNNCNLFKNIFDSDSHFKIGRPAEIDWLEFWQRLEQLNVWDWDNEYTFRGLRFYEGSNWHLYIVHQNKTVKTVGNNSFPPAALNRPSEIFIEFLNAVMKLGNSIT